jgi:hypothetical protein
MSHVPDPSTGIVSDVDTPIVGEEPTAEEIEQAEWAEEAIRTAPALIRDSLRQLITLDTALLAGSAALLTRASLPKLAAAIGIIALLISLSLALWGSMPREGRLRPCAPNQIRRFRERNLKARMCALQWACGFFFASLIVFAAGLLL